MIRDQRGAVAVEMLVVALPVLLLFLWVLLYSDLCAAHMMVQRAAASAARAAVVVIPDDPSYYGDKRAEIERAADTIMSANARLQATDTNVELSIRDVIDHNRESERMPVTAKVKVVYRCTIAMFCGFDGTLLLQAESTLLNQGARYRYTSEG